MVSILVNGGLILLGFVLGYFFATPVLVIFTLACVAISVYLCRVCEGEEWFIAMIFIYCAVIANIVMWVTHFVVASDQVWLLTFIKKYILR
jgi:hypothetical protein